MTTQYALLEVKDDTEHDTIHQSLSESFAWLNRMVLLCPMFTRRIPNSNQSRSSYLSFIVTILNIGAILYHLVFVLIEYTFYSSESTVFRIVFGTEEVSTAISRALALYYFYVQFDYPWAKSRSKIQSDAFTIQQRRSLQKYNMIIIFFYTIIMILDLIILVHICYKHSKVESTNHWQNYTATITGRIFIWFPIYLSFAVLGAIFVKYHLWMQQLINLLKDKGKINFEDMLDEYVNV